MLAQNQTQKLTAETKKNLTAQRSRNKKSEGNSDFAAVEANGLQSPLAPLLISGKRSSKKRKRRRRK